MEERSLLNTSIYTEETPYKVRNTKVYSPELRIIELSPEFPASGTASHHRIDSQREESPNPS
jgi:hypothetical protein